MKYMKLGSKPDAFQSDGNNIRFVATELSSDIIVNVGDVKFYLHKFPLLSKSPRLQRLAAPTSEESNDEIDIPDIPGGPAAFEICAKFCYGMIVTLNAYNVVAARCAAEYLEMYESVEKGNLVYKVDVFLSSSVFHSWKDTIIVLQTTKSLQPWSEDLKVVSHCIDSIASKASIDPAEVEWSYTYNRKKLSLENGQWNGVMKQQSVPKDWWAEDLCELEMDSYKRVIMAVKTKGRVSGKVIGEALKAYVYRRLPDFNKSNTAHRGDLVKYRNLLENVVWLLPINIGSVSCSFLLKLLNAASFLDCSENCKKELMKRAGHQLEEASVSDLLILVTVAGSTLYDIDLVINVIKDFLMHENSSARSSPPTSGEFQEASSPASVSGSSTSAVAKLIDGYLAESAKDPNFPLAKFIELAEMISGSSRPVHDGLYRAIDMFLMEHPDLAKSEKKKICNLMDCRKLSPDACMHAVQNDRLPLRVVVQVLFFEQMRHSALVCGGTSLPPGGAQSMVHRENGVTAMAANARNEWDGVPTAGDVSSLGAMKFVGRGEGAGSDRSSGDASKNGDRDDKGGGKVKGVQMPKRLGKFWSGKMQGGENSSSETSESPGSINPDEAKSTPSRSMRHSVS